MTCTCNLCTKHFQSFNFHEVFYLLTLTNVEGLLCHGLLKHAKYMLCVRWLEIIPSTNFGMLIKNADYKNLFSLFCLLILTDLGKHFYCLSEQDEFLDVIYWGRQVLGVALGLVWGFIPLKGFIGLFL